MKIPSEQIDIITLLANVVHQSASPEYDVAVGEFTVDEASTGSKFYRLDGGRKTSVTREDPNLASLYKVLELHALMKAHTGGSWTSFTLTIDKDGKVTTKFEYPDTNQGPKDAR